jgi:hypothetical protein
LQLPENLRLLGLEHHDLLLLREGVGRDGDNAEIGDVVFQVEGCDLLEICSADHFGVKKAVDGGEVVLYFDG